MAMAKIRNRLSSYDPGDVAASVSGGSSGIVSDVAALSGDDVLGDSPADINRARYFLSRWLGSRRGVLGQNMGTSDDKAISTEMGSQFGSMYGADYIGPGSFSLDRMYPSDYGISGSHKRTIMDMASNPWVGGSYVTTKNNDTGEELRTVSVRKNDQNTAVHESAHSMEARPQEGKISKIVSDYGASRDSYLDSPGEIHSRLMEFRHHNKLNPRKRYSLDEVREMRKNSKDYRLFNRYSDEMMLELLNDVAGVVRVDDGRRNV